MCQFLDVLHFWYKVPVNYDSPHHPLPMQKPSLGNALGDCCLRRNMGGIDYRVQGKVRGEGEGGKSDSQSQLGDSHDNLGIPTTEVCITQGTYYRIPI